jgi:hypothetical protein
VFSMGIDSVAHREGGAAARTRFADAFGTIAPRSATREGHASGCALGDLGI